MKELHLLTFLCGITCGMYWSKSCALFLPFSNSWNNTLGFRSLNATAATCKDVLIKKMYIYIYHVNMSFWNTRLVMLFVFTCAASGRQGWTSACSLAHKAPSASHEHCGTTPVSLPLHFLLNTKYTTDVSIRKHDLRNRCHCDTALT